MKKLKNIYKSKCPLCQSKNILFHHDGDDIRLHIGEFSKEATCNDCGCKFTLVGYFKGPLFLSQVLQPVDIGD